MNTSKLSKLERNVYGTNLINAHSLLQMNHIYPQLEKFVGKKIKTSSGWAKGFNIDYLEFPFVPESGESYRVYLHKEYKSLYLFNDVTVKDTEYSGGGYGVTYYKKELFCGTVSDDGILKEIPPLWTITQGLQIVHTADEQRKLIVDIDTLETKLRDLKRKLI